MLCVVDVVELEVIRIPDPTIFPRIQTRSVNVARLLNCEYLLVKLSWSQMDNIVIYCNLMLLLAGSWLAFYLRNYYQLLSNYYQIYYFYPSAIHFVDIIRVINYFFVGNSVIFIQEGEKLPKYLSRAPLYSSCLIYYVVITRYLFHMAKNCEAVQANSLLSHDQIITSRLTAVLRNGISSRCHQTQLCCPYFLLTVAQLQRKVITRVDCFMVVQSREVKGAISLSGPMKMARHKLATMVEVEAEVVVVTVVCIIFINSGKQLVEP